MTPFLLTSAYITDNIGFLDVNRVDPIFQEDPILGATLSTNSFGFGGNIGGDRYQFYPSLGTDKDVRISKGNDTFLTASITTLFFDPTLPTPFYARLDDIELNTSLGSNFIAQLQARLLNPQELPFDLFISPDVDFLSATNHYTGSATESANGGIAQNGKIPEPTSTRSLLALGTLGAASTLKRKLKPSKEKELEKVS